MTNGNGIRHLTLGGHVGFDSLPDQLVNQAVTSGFTFNIMCVGETGLGKSTLMDSLFNTNFENQPQNHREPNVKLDSHTYELEESNVKLKLVRKIIILEKYFVKTAYSVHEFFGKNCSKTFYFSDNL